MGVCCVIFDIDRMLLEFFMNFLNIEKIMIFVFNISCFLRVLCYFQHLKKIGVPKKLEFIFRTKILSHFMSRFMLFSTLKILKSAPSLIG